MNPLPPDPHLRRALAHAPDQEAAPPPHVSAQILAAAHREAGAHAPRPRPAPAWWRRPWGASGALASVLMAGFVGLLWREELPGPAIDGPAPATAPLPTDAVPALATAPATSAQAQPAAAPALQQAQPGTDGTQARAALAARQRREAQARERQMAVERVAPAVAAAGKAAADSTPVAEPTIAVAASPAPMPAPMPAPVPAPVPAPARAAMETPAVLSTPVPSPAPASPPPPRATALAQAPARPAAMALPALPAWQTGDQLSRQPASPAALPGAAQLQQLATLTQGRWTQPSGRPPSGSAWASALLWQRGSAPLGALWLEPGVVWWCAAGQACLRAEVPPDALRALVGGLPGER